MFNWVKQIIFEVYIQYWNKIPIQRGKYRIGWLLNKVFGSAVYKIDGILMKLNPVANIDRDLIAGKGHNPIVKEQIIKSLKQGGIFVDMGANIGYFSLLAAQLPKVKVVAFEPSPREVARLYENIILNNTYNITVVPYGLSEKIEVEKLNLYSDANPGMNSRLKTSDEVVKSVDCFFAPFSFFVSQSMLSEIRVIKIDVEGFEMNVLQGLNDSMLSLNHVDFIVEIAKSHLEKAGYIPKDIYEFFERHGYSPKLGLQDHHLYDEIFLKL
ncbi:MAG TPA: FkbM family methyltransferase [Candidatus Obscuribacterales bacterium]